MERLPFLSQVKDIEKERLITNNFDSLPSKVTVPPLEVKENIVLGTETFPH